MEARLRTARRARLPTLLPLIVLGAWSLLVAALLARHGIDNHYVFRDEANAILFGRDVARDLSLAISSDVARGPERLTGLFAAVAALLFDSSTRQLEALHLSSAVCQGLVAVPVWIAARQLGLGRWQALVPAVLGSSGSFAFYGVLLLPTAVALLCTSLLLCAMLNSLARPGLRADALVIGALALTALARIGWAPLVAALVPATLAACWLGRPAGEPLLAWLRRLPRRLLARHPLLVPLAALLLLVALVKGPSSLLGGGYGGVRLRAHIVGSVVWDNTRLLGAHLAIGTGLVPLMLALPVLARGLARPRDAVEGGFAWLLLGMLAIFSWAYYGSMNEDRYFAVLGPPLILAGTLAVFRRPPPLWSVLTSGGLVAWVVATSYAWPIENAFTHFVAPTSQFFDDIPLGKLSVALPGDPAHETLAWLVAGAAALAATAVVAAARRRDRATVLAGSALLAGLVGWQLVAMDHPARHFTAAVGMASLSAEQLEFVDRAAAGGIARPLAANGAVDPDLDAQLPFVQAYNRSIGPPLSVTVGDAATGISVDWDSGRTIAHETPPRLLLQVNGTAPLALAGQPLPPEPAFSWALLVRPSTPLRTTWVLRGTQADRYPLGGEPVEVRVFADGRDRHCLSGLIVAHPFVAGAVRYRLTGASQVREGIVGPGAPLRFTLPLPGTRAKTVALNGQARTASDGIVRGPTLSSLSVAPCARR